MVPQLVDLYHERPVLWVITSPHYKNKFWKNVTRLDISNILNTEKSGVEKKWKIVFVSFIMNVKKEKSGSSADDFHNTKWFAFESLMFLKDKNKPHSHS